MIRRKSLGSLLLCSLSLTLVVGVGCKAKKKSKPSAADTMSADTMGPDALGPKGVMKAVSRRKPRPAIKIKPRKGALPVPVNAPVIHINLKRLKAAPVFQKYRHELEKRWKEYLAESEILKGLVTACKLDIWTSFDAITASMTMGARKGGLTLIEGPFDSEKVLACGRKAVLDKLKIKATDITVEGHKGYSFKAGGYDMGILALDKNRILFTMGPMVESAHAVLTGKKPSIEDHPFYKKMKAKTTPDTVLSALVASFPTAITSRLPISLLRDLRGAAVTLGLPGEGMAVGMEIDIGDEQKAKSVAQNLPMLLNMIKSRVPQIEEVSKRMKTQADKGWLHIAINLDKETFGKVQGLLDGYLKKRAEKDKEKKRAAPKKGMKAKKGGK